MYVYKYLDEPYEKNLYDEVSVKWRKTDPAISNLKTSKEGKKMHKKRKYNGHNVHKGATIFPMPGKRWSATFMYVVCPEKSVVIGWYEALPNPETGENSGLLGRLTEWRLDIRAPMLGKHGYLQEVLMILQKKCRERLSFQLCHPRVDNLKLFNVNKEEKKMGEIKKIEYYVIDVEMTYADYKTKDTEWLQVRQTGNYFEIPFDGPDCSEYRLNRLCERLLDYVNETKEMFKISFEKSEICSNSVLKITSPYVYISDRANREELCKILAYAVEHQEYPYPICNAGLSKICFYLRECNNQKIYEKVYSEGISCDVIIEGRVTRDDYYFDYIPSPIDAVGLRFRNGRLTHFMLAGTSDKYRRWVEAAPENTPSALNHIYRHDKPFLHVDEVKSRLHSIFVKRTMWKNASYVTFTLFNNQD